MELDSRGTWQTLQFLRGKHQLFTTSLHSYRPTAQSRSKPAQNLPPEAKRLLVVPGKDWDDAAQALREASERQCIMQLFACFERIIRVDGQLRGERTVHQHHLKFVKAASLAPSFVRFEQWLQCWVKVAVSTKHQTAAKTMREIRQQFRDQRNPLMHNDRAVIPPFPLIARKLHQPLGLLRRLAADFPLER